MCLEVHPEMHLRSSSVTRQTVCVRGASVLHDFEIHIPGPICANSSSSFFLLNVSVYLTSLSGTLFFKELRYVNFEDSLVSVVLIFLIEDRTQKEIARKRSQRKIKDRISCAFCIFCECANL